MTRKNIPHLVRARLGVQWTLPGHTRLFATSTRATSDLIVALAADGATTSEVRERINFDREGEEILDFLIEHGHGDRPLQDIVR